MHNFKTKAMVINFSNTADIPARKSKAAGAIKYPADFIWKIKKRFMLHKSSNIHCLCCVFYSTEVRSLLCDR